MLSVLAFFGHDNPTLSLWNSLGEKPATAILFSGHRCDASGGFAYICILDCVSQLDFWQTKSSLPQFITNSHFFGKYIGLSPLKCENASLVTNSAQIQVSKGKTWHFRRHKHEKNIFWGRKGSLNLSDLMVMSGNRGMPDSINRFHHLMLSVKILKVCLLKMLLPDLVEQPSSYFLWARSKCFCTSSLKMT